MKPSFQINDTEQFWDRANENAKEQLNEVKEFAEVLEKRKKRKKVIALSVAAAFLICAAALFVFVLLPQLRYNKALTYIKNGNYEKGIEIFYSLGDYKDSLDRISRTKYDVALKLFNEEKYNEAYLIFDELQDYSDSQGLKKECLYKEALIFMDQEKWEKAKEKLVSLGNYKEAGKNIKECSYQLGLIAIKKENWDEALNIFTSIENYKDSEEQIVFSNYNKAKTYHKEGKYTDAVKIFSSIGEYQDSVTLMNESMYAYVKVHQQRDDSVTYEYLKQLYSVNYEDAKTIYKTLYSWKADCIINNKKEDKVTHSQVLSRYDTVYFHVTLSGGEPNATTKVRYEIVFPGGSVQKGDFGKDWKEKSEGCTWVWFKTPAFAQTGYAYIKLFDHKNNLIGEETVYIGK